MTTPSLRVAVAQATPVLFDGAATAERAVAWLRRAADAGADWVLLPEAYLPAYPRGLGMGTVLGSRSAEGRELYRRLWDSAVTIPGPEVDLIAQAARECGLWVALGAVERVPSRHHTLYCTLLIYGPDGRLRLHHRKLRPTGTERLIWGEGDGSSLQVVDAGAVRAGGLICWENYMPLARAALYAQGIELYLAPTADARETWQATLRHIACESRCFVLGCNQFVRRDDYPAPWRDLPEVRALPEIACRGGSVIYSPLGEPIAGPVYDREELLIAELDLGDLSRARFDFDPAGHYARPDVFELRLRGASTESNTSKR
jgi:nitrilase